MLRCNGKELINWRDKVVEVINYFASDRQGYWLAEIEKSDWSAGQFLYKLLKNGAFAAVRQ